MRRFKRVFSVVMVLALMFSLSASALAAEYDLTAGDISVSADATGQYVTQTGGVQNFKDETEIVITSNGAETSNTIAIESSGGATAEVTLEKAAITAQGESGIDIADGSNVVITVAGDNFVTNEVAPDAYSEKAAIHVADANLTITGASGADTDSLTVNAGTSEFTVDGAAVGSDAAEDFAGSITIEDVSVDANASYGGSAIGSGCDGDFLGAVSINNAEVTAKNADDGAAIGSGEYGSFSGQVTIDHSTVDTYSDSDGAGIGSGYKGVFEKSGSVVVENSNVKTFADDDGSGIGSGQYADFNGTILIDNSKVDASSGDEGVGIGASEGGNFNGSVTIRNGSRVSAESSDDGAGIGAGSPWLNDEDEYQGGNFTGSLVIEDSEVKAIGDRGAAGIGAGDNGGNFTGSVSIRDSEVYAESEDGAASIGAGDSIWNEETETFDGGDFTGSVSVTGKSNLYLFNKDYFNLIGAGDWEAGSGTVTLGPDVTLYDAAYDNAIIQKEEYPVFIFAKLILLSEGVVDTFWRDVEKQIRAAEQGDKITVDAGKRTTMPAFVMDAIEECRVILTIQWDGGEDIVIEEAYGGEVRYSFFRLAELTDLLEND